MKFIFNIEALQFGGGVMQVSTGAILGNWGGSDLIFFSMYLSICSYYVLSTWCLQRLESFSRVRLVS